MNERKVLDVIIPGPRRLLLCALFVEPDRWWSVPDLSAKIGLPARTVRRHLDALYSGGVSRFRRDGAKFLFQPDPGCPVFYELQSLVTKLAPSGECGETILVVEDQEATAQITRILLESWGYRVIEAHSGPEALGVFDERAQEIHLLLTDVIMPQMTGPELANELSRRKPELRIIFMSGYTDEENLQRGSAFLPKPFNPASLARVVRQQLRGISTA